ncbi:hypothetical protein Q4520_19060 [Alteromonas sp. 1_MG-2023]|uniref:hypothetical protein n=1 Tax=Alteromonas sp. 1_MG-2023 TaxID=3062669 RepID=UPI0026E40A80|nr:hypothetical protein [Alteromonas sp. 1_MG-2023]MDO6477528.1 hypothetical protein [Alteromonas sp. 1_MG-2023]
MMIIGNGQLANAFRNSDSHDVVIFASGVSNSSCTQLSEFKREEELLLKSLEEFRDSKFVYFSSCAISAENYKLNPYYLHKIDMENLINSRSSHPIIIRIPQLFGCLKQHSTLINFLYNSINEGKEFNLYSDAHRYVIEINDIVKITNRILQKEDGKFLIDVANPYRYSVMEIVDIMERLLDKRARYSIIDLSDKYELNLKNLLEFTANENLKFDFGKGYLLTHLKNKVGNRK